VPALPLKERSAGVFYTFNYRLNDQLIYSSDHEFADDLEALDVAQRLSKDFEIEVTSGARFVARVKLGNRVLDATDRRSG
jgi:hypothetical protein